MNLEFEIDKKFETKIHIRIQDRTGKKKITLIEGLDPKLDFAKITRALKKTFNTNGTVLEGNIIQINGDFRELIKKFLIEFKIVQDEKWIQIHGV